MIQLPVSENVIAVVKLFNQLIRSNRHDDMLDAIRYMTQAFRDGKMIFGNCQKALEELQQYKYERR